MCGIAGIRGSHQADIIDRMLDRLTHRGPDDRQRHSVPGLSLGVTRLAINDVEHGRQPLFNETGSICMTCNGEIYNAPELREELIQRGHVFASRSDCEVIVHLYEELGVRCFEQLRGMFALAISDGHRLILARDEFGIKPLYYCSPVPGMLVWGSEIKSLLACDAVPATIHREALSDYMTLGYPTGQRTLLQGIVSLSPGDFLVTEGNDIRIRSWAGNAELTSASDKMTDADLIERFWQLLGKSVQVRMAADCPVGVTLSGGLDSSAICAWAAQNPSMVSSFSVFDHDSAVDRKMAAEVAASLETRHREIGFTPVDLWRRLPDLIWSCEVPWAKWAAPAYFLFQGVSDTHKAVLIGEGADELLGGYPEFLSSAGMKTGLAQRLRLTTAAGLEITSEAREQIARIQRTRTLQHYQQTLLDLYPRDQLVGNHLEFIDKMSMRWSVEARVPFLDHDLVQFIRTLPLRLRIDSELGIQKAVLRLAAIEHQGKNLSRVALRRKIGLPGSGKVAVDHVMRKLAQQAGNPEHCSGEIGRIIFRIKQDATTVLFFDLFEELFCRRRGEKPTGFDLQDFLAQRAGRRSNPGGEP